MTYVMTPKLRAALADAIDEEWGDDPAYRDHVRATLDATPDGIIDWHGQFKLPDGTVVDEEPLDSYQTNEDHIVTTIEFFGLGHLATEEVAR